MVILAVLALGCSPGSDGNGTPESIEQEYLFEVRYVNFAWGPVYRGIVIDRQGNVYAYDLGDRAPKFQEPADGIYSKQVLDDKFSAGRKYLQTIDPDALAKMYAKIEPASRGKLSAPVSKGADMGMESYVAFLYDSGTGSYQEVVLYESGDWTRKNSSREANTLKDWLMEIFESRP
jgi:hypothetical protein